MPPRVRYSSCPAYLLAAFLGLLAGLIILWSEGLYPFTPQAFEETDNIYLLAADIGGIPRLFSGEEGLFFSFPAGGGHHTNFLVSWFNVLYPTTWIAWLLPWEDCVQALSWVFLMDFAFVWVGSLYFFRRQFSQLSTAVHFFLMTGCVCSLYVFSAHEYLPFLRVAGVFPFFACSLERFLKSGMGGAWFLWVALLSALSPYFAWMFLLYALIYAATLNMLHRLYPSEYAPVPNTRLLVYTFLGGLAAACLWLPSLILTTESVRYEMSSGWLYRAELYRGLIYATPWMLPPAALGIFLFCGTGRAAKGYKESFVSCFLKNPYFLSYAVICVTGLFTLSYNIWHMGEPAGLPRRFYFTIALSGMAAAAWMLSRRPVYPSKRTVLLYFLISVIGGGALYFPLDWWTDYAYRRILPFLTWSIVCWVLLLPILRRRYALAAGLLSLMTVCLCCSALRVHKPNDEPQNTQAAVELMDWAGRVLQPDSYCRVKGLAGSGSYNFFRHTPLHSFRNMLQTVSADEQLTLKALGYGKIFTYRPDDGGTLFSDALLGIRYYVARTAYTGYDFPHVVAREGEWGIYENPCWAGMGFFIDSDAHTYVPDAETKVEQFYNDIAEAVLPGAPLMQRVEIPLSEGVIPLGAANATTDAASCAFLRSLSHAEPVAFLNKERERVSPDLSGMPHLEGSFVHIPKGAAYMQVKRLGGGELPSLMHMYCLSERRAAELASEMRKNPRYVSARAQTMSIRTSTGRESRILVLPLTWSSSYSAVDNGQDVQVKNTFGFVGIPLAESGLHEIKLSFHLPMQAPALCLSALGLAFFFPARHFFHRRETKKCDSWFGAAILVGVGLLIVVPAVWPLLCPFLR